ILSTAVSSTFGFWSCFLDSNGPITFDSRSGVIVYGIFMGQVDGFFGGLEVVECPSKNEIRSEPLL
ncbi:hypothetical protein A2U01_0079499, partial [Trifolium medium]|nr:hypothetical protein [Trifolium medium]